MDGFQIRRLHISENDHCFIHSSLSMQQLWKCVHIFTLRYFEGFLKAYENFLQLVK